MTMSFKDMVKADLSSVFFNPKEYGEEHTVEGSVIVCIVDDSMHARSGGAEYAVSEDNILLYAKCDDLPARRQYGDSLNLDGRIYIISSWNEAAGMAEIRLMETT